MDIPIVNLYTVGENLGTTTLLRDNRRSTALHCLKRRYSKWFAHRWHYIYVGVLQTLIHLLATHESWEVEAVGNASLCSKVNHCVHHISRASHTETHVTSAMEHHIGSLNEILRSLLHSDTTEERNHLIATCMVGTWNLVIFLLQWINGIVNREALARILVILVDNRLTSEFRYTHNAVSPIHTVLLNRIYRRVNLSTRAVEVCGMHMDAQRFAAHLLGMNTSGIGKPVVGVNDVKLLGACHLSGNYRVIVDFLVQV